MCGHSQFWLKKMRFFLSKKWLCPPFFIIFGHFCHIFACLPYRLFSTWLWPRSCLSVKRLVATWIINVTLHVYVCVSPVLLTGNSRRDPDASSPRMPPPYWIFGSFRITRRLWQCSRLSTKTLVWKVFTLRWNCWQLCMIYCSIYALMLNWEALMQGGCYSTLTICSKFLMKSPGVTRWRGLHLFLGALHDIRYYFVYALMLNWEVPMPGVCLSYCTNVKDEHAWFTLSN